MSDTTQPAQAAAPQAAMVIERTYPARVEELWALWTTREGFGPGGDRRASGWRSMPWTPARAARSTTT
jgi:hypothetical protein